MKLTAFGCGRRNGNTEIYIKEALMAAESLEGDEAARIIDANLSHERPESA